MVGQPSYLGVATGDWVAALKSSDSLERRLAAHALGEIGPAAPCGSFAAQLPAGPDIAVAKPTIAPHNARIRNNAANALGTRKRSRIRVAGCSRSLSVKAKTNGNTISAAT